MDSLTTNQALGIGAVLGGMFAVVIVCAIAWYILLIIAMWKIFAKAGVAGWKSLIPIYNVYKYCQIIGISFWIYVLLVPFVLGVVTAIFNNQDVTTIVSGLYSIFIYIFMAIKTGKAFDKSAGFIVGLVLLSNIFELILAFGSSKYVGDYKEA